MYDASALRVHNALSLFVKLSIKEGQTGDKPRVFLFFLSPKPEKQPEETTPAPKTLFTAACRTQIA